MIVYIDHSDINEGALDALKEGVARLVEFIRAREPQLISYGFYFDDAAMQMSVIAIHPDSASLELHMEIGGEEFRKLGGFLSLRSIEIYGRPSEDGLKKMREKLAMLGEGGRLVVQDLHAGFGV